ncbi:response regulator transcription factor [Frankia sp. CNm7]|uniref:Response regulator transcription factor n=1 Tax=Frankia nepalensis TaxID=1836974 RepID=A0A937UTR8_9ACTN|nr:response regulator transcription factor [Frankia nepalensis]MBL7497471.1 response regulator transcription factor [Frankia nepalensis]MBL7509588.1 response regulator transcription factor [Frankia nepalensis]MBL7519277.1 response regulator transcription factor [Frankia nepalensis]MBL7633373.1 response regulator transcription factor [Frankia nepalensis]
MRTPDADLAAAASASSAGAPLGVLVVDDQALFREVARYLVGALPGWSVVAEAASGEEGVELAGRIRPALVLMDVHLPGIDGVEATRRIVAGDPSAAVLLMSSYGVEDLPPGAAACGAVGYVRKDELTPRTLRGAVAGHGQRELGDR